MGKSLKCFPPGFAPIADENGSKNAFHATVNPAGSCGDDRFTMAQKIEFKGNNTPTFGIPQPLSEMLVPPSGE